MAFDPSDNYDVLFGGVTLAGDALGDTWQFSAGRWTNLTTLEKTSPEARSGAAMATSPDGHVLMFGGADASNGGTDYAIIENSCNNGTADLGFGSSAVGWWFFHGKWSPMGGYGDTNVGLCAPAGPATPAPQAPQPSAAGPTCTSVCASPPCGRVNPSLGWSPKNARFVLYGGYGPTDEGLLLNCTGGPALLRDTWTYSLPSGGGFYWFNATGPSDPPARELAGYASDFTDDYFEVFGGLVASTPRNTTWRFYEPLHAELTGPLSFDTGGLQLSRLPFIAIGYGGSGNLDYHFAVQNSRNTNTLDSSGPCSWFYNASASALPFSGTVDIACVPAPKDYGIYRITVTVTDVGDSSNLPVTANWTYSVIPPEVMRFYSEYVTDFYSNVDFKNQFTIYAEVAGGAPTRISATLGGTPLKFTASSNPKYWNATIQMSSFHAGAILSATAQFPGWTENGSFAPTIIDTPSWLLSLISDTGATQSIVTHGSGPWNKTYTIDERYSWSLSNATNFSIPVTLVGGSYGLIPSVNVMFSATSAGDLSITGSFSLNTPAITIGPASLKISASLSLTGTFDVVGSGVHWGSATAAITVTATLTASIPIYGFSIFGINVGFTLQLTISPSITLDMILAPLTPGGQSIISNVDVEIQKFLGSFQLALSAAINFGIGIASIGLGVGLSVAIQFVLNPFHLAAGWVNGSIFVTASFLFWSDSFNIVGPSTIYSWDPPAALGLRDDPYSGSGYNNGTGTQWVPQLEYYKASNYDSDLWSPSHSSGPAISDIYPYTEVSAAPAYNGAYLFYTDNDLNHPSPGGLTVSGAALNSTSNALTIVGGPSDPGFDALAVPQATTLPDGSVYVLWAALPNSESSVNSPLNLTSLDLQGAPYYPANGSWGPVRTYSSGGFAESYLVDATGGSTEVVELVSSTPLLQNAGPERLVGYDLATGAVASNVSVMGLSELISVRGASKVVLAKELNGNYSLLGLSSGTAVALGYSPPAQSESVSAAFAQGSPSTLVLLDREPLSSELVLYDTASQQTLATLDLGVDAFQAEAIASGTTYYVFVRSSAGIEGWTVTGGTFANLTTIPEAGVQTYGLVQAAGSIVVYSIAVTGGNSTDPIKSLLLFEIGAALPLVSTPPHPRTSPTSTSASAPNWSLYLGIAAALGAVLLAVIAISTRRRPPKDSGSSAGPAMSPPPSPPSPVPPPVPPGVETAECRPHPRRA